MPSGRDMKIECVDIHLAAKRLPEVMRSDKRFRERDATNAVALL